MKNECTKRVIMMAISAIIFSWFSLWVSSSMIGVLFIVLFIAILACGCSCDDDHIAYKIFDNFVVWVWFGSFIAVAITSILYLFNSDKLLAKHVLKDPAFVGKNKICGIENNQTKCYSIEYIPNTTKYKIETRHLPIIVKEYGSYNVVDRLTNVYYRIGDK